MFLLIVSMFLTTFPVFGPTCTAVVSHPTNKPLTMQTPPATFRGPYFRTPDAKEANSFVKNLNSRGKSIKDGHSSGNQTQQPTLDDILTDQSLWGKDFPSVLSSLPAFTRAGERQVAVLPDKVLGRAKFTRPQATRKLPKLAQELRATPSVKSRSPKLETYMTRGRTALRAQVIELLDDRTFRISATGPTVQFLAPGLSIADVKKRLGKEERITTEILDNGTERRPVILTLHHYAGGAVIFVESDVNPNIGSVDRVFLDAQRISAALF